MAADLPCAATAGHDQLAFGAVGYWAKVPGVVGAGARKFTHEFGNVLVESDLGSLVGVVAVKGGDR